MTRLWGATLVVALRSLRSVGGTGGALCSRILGHHPAASRAARSSRSRVACSSVRAS